MGKPSLAIVGSGISAMGAAYLLKDRFDITFYERNNYPGGHTNTLSIDEDGRSIPIDAAFIVYNETTYPLLTRLFKELDVPTKPTDMSFSVQHLASGLEYCGTGLRGLFAQPYRMFSPKHVRMLTDVARFREQAGEVLANPHYQDYSLAQYIQEKKYSRDFLEKFLIPMSSAVWSTPFDAMLDFPAITLIRFFKNHCFLDLKGQLPWRTCDGGSRVYRDKIMSLVAAKVLLNAPVHRLRRLEKSVEITTEDQRTASYDYALLACHADEALEILSDATDQERKILSKFPYHPNRGVLHTDESLMPKIRSTWSSWNYRVEKSGLTSTIYWMNNLQGVSQKKNYFISINDPNLIDPKKIIWQTLYSHPLYSTVSAKAQPELEKLNGTSRVFFAGAYFRYGFHEDGLMSGVSAARALAGEKLWE